MRSKSPATRWTATIVLAAMTTGCSSDGAVAPDTVSTTALAVASTVTTPVAPNPNWDGATSRTCDLVRSMFDAYGTLTTFSYDSLANALLAFAEGFDREGHPALAAWTRKALTKAALDNTGGDGQGDLMAALAIESIFDHECSLSPYRDSTDTLVPPPNGTAASVPATITPSTNTDEYPPPLWAFVTFAEIVEPDQLATDFRSGASDWGILRVGSRFDWNASIQPPNEPFRFSGSGEWYLVGVHEGSIWPVVAFDPPNEVGDNTVARVSVEVVGAGENPYPFVIFNWCCPMGDSPRSDEMVAVARVIDGELLEVTTGEPLNFNSPTFWVDERSPFALALTDGARTINLQVDRNNPLVLVRT